MGRLIVIVFVVAATLVVVMSAAKVVQSAVDTTKEASVPDTAKTISYVLLIVLMFGVVTGWLGGL